MGGRGVGVSDLNNVQMMLSKEDVDLLSACYQTNDCMKEPIKSSCHTGMTIFRVLASKCLHKVCLIISVKSSIQIDLK